MKNSKIFDKNKDKMKIKMWSDNSINEHIHRKYLKNEGCLNKYSFHLNNSFPTIAACIKDRNPYITVNITGQNVMI